MNNDAQRIRKNIIVALVVAGGLVGGAIAFAQNSEVDVNEESAGITFPVVELGNCATREECHNYCDEGGHMGECIAFAKSHGLMNKEEADRSEKFSKRLQEGKTPGGCDSHGSCNAYCEDVTHLDECVAFAEKNNFKGEEYTRGKKLGAYLKKGGTMPGGCTSRTSCEVYCTDLLHAEECYQFAENAGLDAGDVGDMKTKDGSPQKITLENLKRLVELVKKGETPGGCTNKDACEAYCAMAGHMEECIIFGEKVGIMKKEEAERARKFAQKGGPGGCTSQDSCHDFCNNPANQETCFKFAQENGLIQPKELEQMKEGWVRMRQGLENAPSQVRECVTSTLGGTIIEDIQSGKLVPGPDIGDRVRNCFEKFDAHHSPKQIFFDAPKEVKACLKEKLGGEYEEISSGKVEPTPQTADAFRICFQQVEFEHSNGWGGEQMNEGGGMSGERGNIGPDPEMFERFLRSAPPEVQTCLKEKLGERFEKIRNGELVPGPEMGEMMHSCFENFRPMGNETPEGADRMPQSMPPQDTVPPRTISPQTQMMNFMNQFPPEIEMCLKDKLGEAGFTKVATDGKTPELEMAIHACWERLQTRGGVIPQPLPYQDGSTVPSPTAGWTSKLPFPVQDCLKAKLGERFAQLGYQQPTPETEMMVRACYAEVSGGNMPTDPSKPPIIEGTMMPPPEPIKLETRRRTFPEQLLGAVALPFVVLWNLVQ